MDFSTLYHAHQAGMEDFWGRRENGPTFERRFGLFRRPATVTSNDERVISAVDLSLRQFSMTDPGPNPPFAAHIIVRQNPLDPGPPPADLASVTRYAGYGEWVSIQAGAWGHCHIDLTGGRAAVALSPRLAERPELLSRGLLNTIFTNFLIGGGFAMLHCTGLMRDGHALLLMAPHNSGKSTTALRLLLAGFRLISDSQIYLSPDSDALELFGFPVGRIKLRADVVTKFSQLQPFLTEEKVREEIKHVLDLRAWRAELAETEPVRPDAITLALLRQNGQRDTIISPAARDEVWSAVMANSIFYDDEAAWQRNLAQAERLVAAARACHLAIGTSPHAIVDTVSQLLSQP